MYCNSVPQRWTTVWGVCFHLRWTDTTQWDFIVKIHRIQLYLKTKKLRFILLLNIEILHFSYHSLGWENRTKVCCNHWLYSSYVHNIKKSPSDQSEVHTMLDNARSNDHFQMKSLYKCMQWVKISMAPIFTKPEWACCNFTPLPPERGLHRICISNILNVGCGGQPAPPAFTEASDWPVFSFNN